MARMGNLGIMVSLVGLLAATVWISLGISIVAAVAAVASVTAVFWQFRLSGPRIRVEITDSRINPHTEDAMLNSESIIWEKMSDSLHAKYPVKAVAVDVSNAGRMATSIQSWWIDVAPRVSVSDYEWPVNPRVPIRIDPGDRLRFYVELGAVTEIARCAKYPFGRVRGTLHGFVRQGDGKEIRSKVPLIIPVEEIPQNEAESEVPT